ncbi:single-stranded DNA-binding protein [Candidatus Beckwithbacteria bacterium CG23_combo_of_CG06-09_8_20_14_all_34_8]|uniref:Single-stranded DNA-binding protein n=1 Tax=Candidatus Beckwithbacteria bacterium CG23_combo_of_CG06-09_8_20_14_all_34_8 TaxID=1974497 RepID=A0A2H0B6A6_9BACT|nr:MAG: single-stranded DNA-binding protein [Candidatus Beckwithbacteria bacterium CG23_combo_of_CG06-09_8_20_14_all_34_8]
MSSRSLNKVMLIGNLTRDPELRYTPQGTPVCTIGLATNRSWTDSNSQRQEETEFHRLVAWNKLAELCSQLLFKGRKIYVEGRLQTRNWTTQDGTERQTTEVVIDDMIVLDSRRREGEEYAGGEASSHTPPTKPVATASASDSVVVDDKPAEEEKEDKKTKKEDTKKEDKAKKEDKKEELSADDIPF